MPLTLTIRAASGATKQVFLPTPVVAAPSAEPNATTTGTKGTLTTYSGSYTISGDNVLIKDKILNKLLRVTGRDVTIENCRWTASSGWGIDAEGSINLKVRNSTIVGSGNSCILTGENTLVEYCDLSGYDNGIMLSGATATLQYNYIHDLHPGAVGEAHVDGIQMGGGQNGVLIKGNSIRSWDTSCIIMKCDWGSGSPIRNITIDGNWLRNQPGKSSIAATIYAYSNQAYVENIVISNNFLEPGYTGALAYDTTAARNAVTWTNNKHITTGAVVPKP
jgi:hypothetical protein